MVTDWRLIRLGEFHGATFGALILPNFECLTLEEPWRNNHPQISCIPTGRYRLRHHNSATLGHCISVADVPGRSLIRIHSGNTLLDTEGCILVGANFGRLHNAPAVLRSRNTLDKLLGFLSDATWLEVT